MKEWELIRNWTIKVIQRKRSDLKTSTSVWSRFHKVQSAAGGDLLSLPIRPFYPKNEEIRPPNSTDGVAPFRVGHGRLSDFYIPSFEELFP